uniref:Uncharacterized protein n=1 Tax=Oryza brachyantha TaxID=4533 RepID=J3LPC5_ORYBR
MGRVSMWFIPEVAFRSFSGPNQFYAVGLHADECKMIAQEEALAAGHRPGHRQAAQRRRPAAATPTGRGMLRHRLRRTGADLHDERQQQQQHPPGATRSRTALPASPAVSFDRLCGSGGSGIVDVVSDVGTYSAYIGDSNNNNTSPKPTLTPPPHTARRRRCRLLPHGPKPKPPPPSPQPTPPLALSPPQRDRRLRPRLSSLGRLPDLVETIDIDGISASF